jgi:hypothetical protein
MFTGVPAQLYVGLNGVKVSTMAAEAKIPVVEVPLHPVVAVPMVV